MEAPEKIYIHSDNDVIGEVLSQKVEGDIEYIRKDAFVKKAITYLILNTRAVHYSFGDKIELSNPNLEVVIEDFKKYMEE